MSDYNSPQPAQQASGLAIASMVLGILSILFGWIPIIGFVSWVLAPLGLIFGFMTMNRPGSKGFAIAGLVTSAIGLLICLAWVGLFGAAMSQAAYTG